MKQTLRLLDEAQEPGISSTRSQKAGSEHTAQGCEVGACSYSSIQEVPNGVFQTVFFRFLTSACDRENPLSEGQRMPENTTVFSVLVRSALAEPDQPLNAPVWKTPFRKHRLLLLWVSKAGWEQCRFSAFLQKGRPSGTAPSSPPSGPLFPALFQKSAWYRSSQNYYPRISIYFELIRRGVIYYAVIFDPKLLFSS